MPRFQRCVLLSHHVQFSIPQIYCPEQTCLAVGIEHTPIPIRCEAYVFISIFEEKTKNYLCKQIQNNT